MVPQELGLHFNYLQPVLLRPISTVSLHTGILPCTELQAIGLVREMSLSFFILAKRMLGYYLNSRLVHPVALLSIRK
jgi:hypothetical protein